MCKVLGLGFFLLQNNDFLIYIYCFKSETWNQLLGLSAIGILLST
jgi:hypothetical protein